MSRHSASELSDSPIPGIPAGLDTRSHQPDAAERQDAAQSTRSGESRSGRRRRKAHRGRLHLYAFAAVALLAYVIALGATNTRHVKVDWVFGSSSVSLVWLVLFAAILGWLLGILITAAFRWRTRAPRAS
jgi:uncharacterized integral membrane protein